MLPLVLLGKKEIPDDLAFRSSSSQLFSEALLSNSSQQPFSAAIPRSHSQQLYPAAILSSYTQLSSCCGQGLVVSYYQFSAIILLWSGAGGQLLCLPRMPPLSECQSDKFQTSAENGRSNYDCLKVAKWQRCGK